MFWVTDLKETVAVHLKPMVPGPFQGPTPRDAHVEASGHL